MIYPQLPRWSALFIEGDDVTETQAQEILIRTTDPWIITRNRDYELQYYQLLGIQYGMYGPVPESVDEYREKHHVLRLKWMQNYRIATEHIAGPRGWCSWTGKIRTAGEYSISMPDVAGVLAELKTIVTEWPFLHFRMQLWNSFLCAAEDSNTKPLVEYYTRDGEVTVCVEDLVPMPVVEHWLDRVDRHVLEYNTLGILRETGISMPRLRDAVNIVRHKFELSPL